MKTLPALPERIRAYLAKCPGAISGADGHKQTFTVACALINGFALTESEALAYLHEYNRTCDPPWTDRELEHKIQSAVNVPHEKARGHLLGSEPGRIHRNGSAAPAVAPVKPAPEKPPPPKYEVSKPAELPPPMEDAARKFIMAAFLPGEGVAAVAVVPNAEGKATPAGKDLSLTREEWMVKLESVNGDPNKIFPGAKSGAFIRVNPMTIGKNTDADVTSFRHTLLEFDNISLAEQWNLYQQSEIPCTAILSSGGKSIHAWVRVDAKDRKEYNHRVAILYDHFSHYGVDNKNKNPSRYSRLPGMRRGDKTQDLLALNTGAKSFSQWLVDRAADGIGQQISVKELLAFDPANDPNCLIGRRWLCKGGSCLWLGSSGVGKSALAMQAALTWGMARPLFGVTPPHPLKSLFIQAENDLGDMAEMMQGVLDGLASAGVPNLAKAIKENLVIVRESTRTGKCFTDAVLRLIEKHRPDLVWIDPLLSFLGDDVSSQRVCSEFLRNWLNPISEATGVCWQILHHTGKPSTDPKSKKTWVTSDYAYSGLGSSELVNWARAVVFLQPADETTFKLIFTKRGNRAGAKDLSGEFAKTVFVKHSERGICWVQCAEPQIDENAPARGPKKKTFNYDGFLARFADQPMITTELVETAMSYSKMSERWIYDNALFTLKSKMTFNPGPDTYVFNSLNLAAR